MSKHYTISTDNYQENFIDGDCYTFNENHSFSENYWLHSSNLKEDGH